MSASAAAIRSAFSVVVEAAVEILPSRTEPRPALPLVATAKEVQAILDECPLFFYGLEAFLKELDRNPVNLRIACNSFEVAMKDRREPVL